MPLTLFTIGWIIVLYLFNSALVRSFKRMEAREVFLYVTTVALIGVFGEVFVNTLYTALVGSPLWFYHVLPIHGGFTSLYSVVVWGMYGFYLYLLHDTWATRKYSTTQLATIISIEAIVLELLINTSHLAIFNEYIFYYLPSDLWHLTSIVAIPFYFLGGYTILKSIQRFQAEPVFFTSMSVLLMAVLVGMAG
jgi:hypothetical protein